MKRWVLAAVLLAWTSASYGQIIQGTITGTVTDASAASIPGVEVSARSGGPQNPSDPRGDYGNCSFLVQNTFVTNFLHELSFGHGKDG